MGVVAGIEQKNVKSIVRGIKTDEGCTPMPFTALVNAPSYQEPWCTAIYMFHNPKALNPIRPELFPRVIHIFEEDGEIVQYLPPNYIISSTTHVFEFK